MKVITLKNLETIDGEIVVGCTKDAFRRILEKGGKVWLLRSVNEVKKIPIPPTDRKEARDLFKKGCKVVLIVRETEYNSYKIVTANDAKQIPFSAKSILTVLSDSLSIIEALNNEQPLWVVKTEKEAEKLRLPKYYTYFLKNLGVEEPICIVQYDKYRVVKGGGTSDQRYRDSYMRPSSNSAWSH